MVVLFFLPEAQIGFSNRLLPAEASGLMLLRLVGCHSPYHQYKTERNERESEKKKKTGEDETQIVTKKLRVALSKVSSLRQSPSFPLCLYVFYVLRDQNRSGGQCQLYHIPNVFQEFCEVTKIPRICFLAPEAKLCLRVCADGCWWKQWWWGVLLVAGGGKLELLRKRRGMLRARGEKMENNSTWLAVMPSPRKEWRPMYVSSDVYLFLCMFVCLQD